MSLLGKGMLALSAAIFSVSLASGQTWSLLSNTPPLSGYNPMLMTDGTIFVQDVESVNWWKLTPDIKGSYLNGTWTKLASTPGYGPLYYAEDVLPDGRIFTMGGEYNLSGPGVWQNQGFIYDPQKDQWTKVTPPATWANLGDMGSVVLPNGKVLLANPIRHECGLFDPVTNTITAPYGTGKIDGNDEEGLTLLPNGTILTVDTTPNSSEIFNPLTATWSFAGTTPALLVGQGSEIGPQVLRPDGTVICFGGGPHNCVYNTKTGIWTVAPSFPSINGVGLDCADACACLLPSGHVLVQTSPGLFMNPSMFFEWDGTNMNPAPSPKNAAFDPSFVGSMLMLPTGQMLYTDFSSDIEIYTPAGSPNPAWAPTITSFPSQLKAGTFYTISGTQFNGLSGNSAYGDDEQNFTNYPLIRVTMTKTGDVFYCREFNPSTMAICTGNQIVTTNFAVPSNIELGPATLQVVTNGIASKGVAVTVLPVSNASGVETYVGTHLAGNLNSIQQVDGSYYAVQSTATVISPQLPVGQVAAVEGDFVFASSNVAQMVINVTCGATPGASAMLYVKNWTTGQYVYLNTTAIGAAQTAITAKVPGSLAPYFGPAGQVSVIVRTVVPPHLGSNPIYTLSVDAIQVQF